MLGFVTVFWVCASLLPITGTKWTSKENVYCSPTLTVLSWRAAGRRGVSGLALLTFTPRGAGKDSARSSLLGFKFHGFLLSRFDPNVPMGQRTPVPNGRGRGGMETLQRGHVRAWQLRAVCSPGGEQSGPREDRGWEVSSYRPGNLGLVTEHTQRPGCQEAEGFLRVSVKPRKVPLA